MDRCHLRGASLTVVPCEVSVQNSMTSTTRGEGQVWETAVENQGTEAASGQQRQNFQRQPSNSSPSDLAFTSSVMKQPFLGSLPLASPGHLFFSKLDQIFCQRVWGGFQRLWHHHQTWLILGRETASDYADLLLTRFFGFFFVCLFFWGRVSLGSPGWPWTWTLTSSAWASGVLHYRHAPPHPALPFIFWICSTV
jgi:hypothetical protein